MLFEFEKSYLFYGALTLREKKWIYELLDLNDSISGGFQYHVEFLQRFFIFSICNLKHVEIHGTKYDIQWFISFSSVNKELLK